ncbi:MAG: beta-1,6-N-acetylglucosaminyltransferase [Winogradskyella sp.]
MKHHKVYLILAHKSPNHLRLLIDSLQDGNSTFFIHVDKKVNINDFTFIKNKKNVFFTEKRVHCNWGGFSLVEATLIGLNAIYEYCKLRNIVTYHAILLSGQDLPLKHNSKIQEFLANKVGQSVFNYWELPYKNWWDGGMFRLNKVYFFNVRSQQKLNLKINKWLIRLRIKKFYPINRIKRIDYNFKLYGSSQWFILSENALKALFLEKELYNKLSSALRYAFAPDELFFINFFKHIELKTNLKILNLKTTYVEFKGADANPKFVEMSDLNKDFDDSVLFGRKFDLNKNARVVKEIIKRVSP